MNKNKFPFTPSQWQELEHQALVYKYMAYGISIPPDLFFTIIKSFLDSPLSSTLLPNTQQHHFFQYPPNHNVVEVTKSDYESCQQTNPIQSSNDGATTIPLTSQGKRYFICGTIGHCSQGMKVEINTLATQISHTSLATTSPPTTASPPIADSPIVSIIPSAAPQETTTPSPAESPESPSPLFQTQMETPTLSPVIPSTKLTYVKQNKSIKA
ncbi:hypothetical protein RYX36_016888 [Vicia faba]